MVGRRQKLVEPAKTVPRKLVKSNGFISLIDDESIVVDVGERISKQLGYAV